MSEPNEPRRKPSQQEVDAILSNHWIWIETDGVSGTCADFRNLDLAGFDLSAQQLCRADFSGADLSGADCSRADLTAVAMANAILRGAKFREADLTGAVGMTSYQIARCDITGTKLPDNIKDLDQLKVVHEVSELAQRHFTGIVLACGYCLLTIATTRDSRLYANDESVMLPIIKSSLPLFLFFWFAPAVLLVYFVYFHICLQRLWEGVVALPARFPDGVDVYEKTNRWMLNGPVRWSLGQTHGMQPMLMRSQIFASFGLAYWLVPATIGLITFRYAAKHDWPVTAMLHCAIFGLAAGTALYMEMLAIRTLKSKPNATSRSRVVAFGSVAAVTLLLCLYVATVRLPYYETHVNFREADVSSKPKNWDAISAKLSQIMSDKDRRDEARTLLHSARGVRLSGAHFEWVRAFGAFLVNSDLSAANLSHGDLFKADLRGAKLEDAVMTDAWLYEANFQMSDLRGAKLSHSDGRYADFRGADIFQTNLSHSDLRYAQFEETKVAGDLQDSCLQHAHMKDAILAYGNLERADLDSTDLRGAHLNYTLAMKAILSNANLADADLSDANLTGADLRWANLSRAKIDRAFLQGADLRDLRFDSALDQQKFVSALNNHTAYIDATTKCSLGYGTVCAAYETKPHEAMVVNDSCEEGHLPKPSAINPDF